MSRCNGVDIVTVLTSPWTLNKQHAWQWHASTTIHYYHYTKLRKKYNTHANHSFHVSIMTAAISSQWLLDTKIWIPTESNMSLERSLYQSLTPVGMWAPYESIAKFQVKSTITLTCWALFKSLSFFLSFFNCSCVLFWFHLCICTESSHKRTTIRWVIWSRNT